MSTDRTPAPPAAATPSAPPKKPRSPAEKLIVRGGIVLLLVLVAVQAHARFGYEMSLKKLQSRLAAEDETENGAPLLVSEVPGLIVGFPTKVEEKDRHWNVVTYKWRGLTQSFEIRMPYDTSDPKPAILSLETKGAPAEKEVTEAELAAAAGASSSGAHAGPGTSSEGSGSAGGSGGPGSGGPGGGGPGGGGQRFNLMDSDADSDGKVSRAEAPARFAENFERADANTDGFIDAEEYAEYRRIRAAEREAAGGGGGPGGRPQQPATDAPADKPAEATPPADAKPAAESAEAKSP